MIYGSICSGIESASVAWKPLGWRAAWFSEIEPFPCEVLKQRWPNVVNHGDMLNLSDKILNNELELPDVLVGGTPCQAFSVAGLRNSLDDDRGQLTLEYVRIANVLDQKRREAGKPESIIIWENVPGVLNTKDNAFGCFIAALCGEPEEIKTPDGKWSNAGCVVGPQRTVSWRILDAQYFGVAQRRRRVFVVASARIDISTPEILFEFKGVRRDTPPSRKAKEEVAHTITTGVRKADSNGATNLIPMRMTAFGEYSDDNTASTIKARDYKDATDLVVHPIQNATRGKSQNGLGVSGNDDPMYTFDQGSQHAVAFAENSTVIHGTQDPCLSENVSFSIGRNNGGENILTSTIRRLTPVECERLQGFPDDYTRVRWRNKNEEACPDSPRYKAIGNSKAVPVIRWIGEQISKELGCWFL